MTPNSASFTMPFAFQQRESFMPGGLSGIHPSIDLVGSQIQPFAQSQKSQAEKIAESKAEIDELLRQNRLEPALENLTAVYPDNMNLKTLAMNFNRLKRDETHGLDFPQNLAVRRAQVAYGVREFVAKRSVLIPKMARDEIRRLLSEAEDDKALAAVKKFYPGNDHLMDVEGRFAILNRNKICGLLTYEQQALEAAQICDELLEYVDEPYISPTVKDHHLGTQLNWVI